MGAASGSRRNGSLFVSAGDNQRLHLAEDSAPLPDKVLHLWPGTGGRRQHPRPVHTMGHGNRCGLASDDAGKRLFATKSSNAERDEVNLIEAGDHDDGPHREVPGGFDAGDAPWRRRVL